jgi:hypothetical protein
LKVKGRRSALCHNAPVPPPVRHPKPFVYVNTTGMPIHRMA